MGRKLDAFFGRTSKKTLKLKTLLGLTVSRLSILKNQRQILCSHAHGDVAQLLQLGHHDRALLRAEFVVKEENMLDVLAMLQGYCHLLTERAVLLENQKDCPDELREAISSLIYASSRCGDLPELLHVRSIFSSMFGKEFTNAAIDLRNNCGVNPKMIQKLSTRQPSLESRVRVTKEIAAEKGITLDLIIDDPYTPGIAKVDPNSTRNKNQGQAVVDWARDSSMNGRHKYKDAVSAAQAAFESAELAAAAAKVAVELSRSSQSPDDHYGKKDDGSKGDQNNLESIKIHPAQNCSSESDEEEAAEHKSMGGLEKSPSTISSDSTETPLYEEKVDAFRSGPAKRNGKDIMFDNKSESEDEKQWGLSSGGISAQGFKVGREFDATSDDSDKHEVFYLNPLYQKRNPVRKYREDLNSSFQLENDQMGLESANKDNLAESYYSEMSSQTKIVHQDSAKKLPTQHSKVAKTAVSVRTRRGLQR